MDDMREYRETNQIADYLLLQSSKGRSVRRKENLTQLKLQKLIFYADAWHLVKFDAQATPERFQAWIHGPVARSQWDRFKEYRWHPIDVEKIRDPEISKDLSDHLDEILEVFGNETANSLEIMTHREKPWMDARKGIPYYEHCDNYISKKTTKEFYKNVANQK